MGRYLSYAASAMAAAAVLGGCIRVKLPPVTVIRGEPQTLSWERAVELALAHHPDILRARWQLKSAARVKNIAVGAYLPTVDGDFIRERSKMSHQEQKAMDGAWKDNTGIGLTARQSIFSGFKTTGEYIKAKKEWEAAKLTYEERSAEVRRRLRASFIALIRLWRFLDVSMLIADRRRENAELILLRYEAGRENRGALLRAEAQDEEARFDVRKTRRAIESQAWRLSRELGGPFILALQADGDLEEMLPEPPATPPDYPAITEDVPAINRLVKNAEVAKTNIVVEQSSVWPKAEGQFRYGHTGEIWPEFDDQLRFGLTVTMPLFRGGRNVFGIARAKADYDAAMEEARSGRDNRIAELSSSWTTFKDARERVNVRSAFLAADNERADIVRRKYASGLVDFQEFDIAEQDLTDSEREYVQSLADALTSEAEWEFLKGATLEDVINEE